jgi:transcriptional regulator of acetoin/glycerol metabolism
LDIPAASASLAMNPSTTDREASCTKIQRTQVLAAFAETGNKVSKTARRLGGSRNTIYRTLHDKPF